ncbi:MAG TPA: hypothetical protein VH351_15040, partial [Bryobacteraceae bacterium]|nr:hypothetical protein [Bryobacteraceae bacterium]
MLLRYSYQLYGSLDFITTTSLLAALWQENRCEQGGGRQPKVHASAETLRTLPQTGSPGRFSGKRGS